MGSLVACAKGEPLTLDALQEAQARWRASAPNAYTLKIEISGDLVQEGEFEVTVRGDEVVKATRNGQVITTRDAFYTVPGMHAFLREELEMAQNPARYWNASPETRIYQRAHFDPELGYTRRYLRAVTGTQHNVVITIRLSPLP